MSYVIHMALRLVGYHWDLDSADPVESNGGVIPNEIFGAPQEQIRKSDEIIGDLLGRVSMLETQIAQDRGTVAVLTGQIQALQAQKAQEQTATGTLLGRVNTLEAQIVQDREAAAALRGLQGANGQSGTSLSTTSYSEKTEIFYADGRIYTGGWIDGRPQGYGEMKFPNGNHYAGFWNNGLQEGQGTLEDADGKVIYKGEWKQGGRHGTIKYTNGPLDRYSFIWNCGHLDQISIGAGFVSYKIYNPPVEIESENPLEPLKSATLTGEIRWWGGIGEERYQGELQYHRDCFRPHGQGWKIFKDETKLEGIWHEGEISGQGVLTFKEGQSFEGQFSNFPSKFGAVTRLEREGHPTTLFFHKNGWRYEGSVEKRKGPSGQGKMYRGEELLYQGEFSKGLYHGRGERFAPLKGIIKFEGDFKEGVPDGDHGVIYLENGDRLSGTWKDGELELSNVLWSFPNGITFRGSLEMVGKRVWFQSGGFELADKSTIEGFEWCYGALQAGQKDAIDLPLTLRSLTALDKASQLSYFQRWDRSPFC
ncbi:MAG: hypothetical protein JSS61_06535 [Verrucomicrobia bacterium]|nr:hypothetical protein [Verrucomicrobiota bacterium]